MNKLIFILIVLVVGGSLVGAGVWYAGHRNESGSSFRTASVTRGDLLVSISATGTVEPEEVVDVGAQVAGRILSFGTDTDNKSVDYGSFVKKGMLLAKIDDELYQADLTTAQAQFEAAKAGVDRAVADVGQLKAKLYQAQRDWERAQKLGPSDALSQVDYDAYQSGFEVAKANVAVGEAAVEQAQREVVQREASMKRAQQNLSYCTIPSPVDGVIIDRRVNIGQTVVASLNAPSLFLIAQDLKRMEVWVAVNEADIGQIKVGQRVTFTVDSFPGQTLVGQVSKVRLNATMTQNVVTFTVEVTTDNSSSRLLPYLTANVSFEISRHEDVLLAPNAALRYTPSKPEMIAEEARKSEAAGAATRPSRGRGRAEGANAASTTRPMRDPTEMGGAPRRGTLWVQEGEFLKPIQVRLGATDGINTEILSDSIKEGQLIVTGEVREDAAIASGPTPGSNTGAGGNPFLPQMPRGGRGMGGGRGGR